LFGSVGGLEERGDLVVVEPDFFAVAAVVIFQFHANS